MPTPRTSLAPFCIILFLAACGGSPAASVSAVVSSPTTALSLSPTREDTQTSTAFAESTPTQTAPAATAAPTGLNPSGPHILFDSDQGVWIANPDGGFPARLSEFGTGTGDQDLRDAVSPDGGNLAVAAVGKTGVDLILIDLPGGQAKTVARLLDVTRNELALNSLSPEAFAYYAITDFPNLAWQPADGGVLAYVSAENGPTTDTYTYDPAWDKFRHLEQNPSQSIGPIWSPDGEYLLFFGIHWLPPYGPTYVTFQPMEGFWAVHASDGEIIPQPKLKGTYRNFLGWQDGTHYLVYDTDEECAARNLRAVDLLSGDSVTIADFCFRSRPAWSPENRAVMLSTDSGCGCEIGEGVFLFLPGRPDPVRLSEKPALELFWLAEGGVFFAYPDALFSADGGTRYDPPAAGVSFHPAVSRNGDQAWEVIENHRSRVTVRTAEGAWRDILEGNVSLLAWDPFSGDTLLIVLENGDLFSAAAPDFAPQPMGTIGWKTDQATWIAA